jgi:hypothetical protein
MRNIRLTLLIVSLIAVSTSFAFARGGGAGLLNSPGYQRALQESHKSLATQAAPVQPNAAPTKKKHKRHN